MGMSEKRKEAYDGRDPDSGELSAIAALRVRMARLHTMVGIPNSVPVVGAPNQQQAAQASHGTRDEHVHKKAKLTHSDVSNGESSRVVSQFEVFRGEDSDGDSDREPSPGSSMQTDPQSPANNAVNALEEYDSSSSGSETSYRIREVPLSTVHLTRSNIDEATAKTLTVTLKHEETLVLIGLYDIWVKRGSILVLGAVLSPSERVRRVYAPSTHALPEIICGSPEGSQIAILSCSSGIRYLRDMSPLFGRIWNDKHTKSETVTSEKESKTRSFSVLHKSSDDPKKRHLTKFTLDRTWAQLARTLSTRLYINYVKTERLMICGPKAIGKSTLCQYLVNHLVTIAVPRGNNQPMYYGSTKGVMILDLDPGQPLLNPPGQVSLSHVRTPWFGPQFTHPKASLRTNSGTLRAHHVGAVTLKGDPYYYIQCVLDLLTHFERRLQAFPSCPLIINTPAWITGAGLEVFEELLPKLGVTTLVFVGAPLETQDPLRGAANRHNIEIVQVAPAPSDLTTRTGKELETMQMLSYFHLIPPMTSGLKWSRTPLFMTRPWELSYTGDDQAISAIFLLGDQDSSDYLDHALEGAMMAVVALEDATVLTASHNGKPILQRCSKTHLPWAKGGRDLHTALPPATCHSFGLAVIRHIDCVNQMLQLHTPILTSSLIKVLKADQPIVLVQSNLETPEWLIQEDYHSTLSSRRRIERRLKARGEWDEDMEEMSKKPKWGETQIPWVKYEADGDTEVPNNRVKKVDRSGPGLRETENHYQSE